MDQIRESHYYYIVMNIRRELESVLNLCAGLQIHGGSQRIGYLLFKNVMARIICIYLTIKTTEGRGTYL